MNAVSEVDAPRESGCESISIVGKAMEKAPNASDRNTHRDWNGEKISGPAGDPNSPLCPFHREGTTQESADDRLTNK